MIAADETRSADPPANSSAQRVPAQGQVYKTEGSVQSARSEPSNLATLTQTDWIQIRAQALH